MSFREYASGDRSASRSRFDRSTSQGRFDRSEGPFVIRQQKRQNQQGTPEISSSIPSSPLKELTGIDRFRQKYQNKNSNQFTMQTNNSQTISHVQRREESTKSLPPSSMTAPDGRSDEEERRSRNNGMTGGFSDSNIMYWSKNQSKPPINEKRNVMFVRLSEEVSLFQKDVGDLVKAVYDLKRSSTSAEEWKCKVQIDQIGRRGEEIEQNLRLQETSIQQMTRSEAANARSSHLRLTRDFRYVQSTFKTLRLEFNQRREQYDQSRYSSAVEGYQANECNGVENNVPLHQNSYSLHIDYQHEEEYALRVMREREHAISDINKKMHQVNEIYKDLGHIVMAQQDQIDLVENTIEQSCNNARCGLDHLEKTNKTNKNVNVAIQESQQHLQQQQHLNHVDVNNENINYMTPGCGLGLSLDMSDMSKDLKNIGSDAMTFSVNTLRALQGQLLRCAIMQDR